MPFCSAVVRARAHECVYLCARMCAHSGTYLDFRPPPVCFVTLLVADPDVNRSLLRDTARLEASGAGGGVWA